MTNRVTHRTIQESTLANLQGNLRAMATLQEQLSTGKRINRPSDDPSGTVSALQLRQDLRANEQHTRNADDGTAWLTTQDTALQTASTRLQRARTLVVQALNSGAQGSDSLADIGVEVEGISKDLQALANTQYLGRNVFAGTSGAEPAVRATATGGVTGAPYSFADTGTGQVTRQVDSGSPIRVDSDGRTIFGVDTASSPTASVFSFLDDLAQRIRSGGATGADLSSLDAHLSGVLTGLADVGARTNRIQRAQDAAADAKLTLTSRLSDAQDVDLPATIVDLQMQQAAYQAALGATAKVLQPSLMDFLK